MSNDVKKGDTLHFLSYSAQSIRNWAIMGFYIWGKGEGLCPIQ